MDNKQRLIIAKQKAHNSRGSNFYVTNQGIKRDFDLMGAKYVYKVYYNNGLYVEDFEGNKIEKPIGKKIEKSDSRKAGNKKTSISSELRDIADAEASEPD